VPVNVRETSLEGVFIIMPKRFGDERGFFEETWSARDLEAEGIDLPFVQDNHSFSATVGTLRGLHFQAPPHAQDKLVRCTQGAIFDVAVDIRVGSPTYGQWIGEELSRENGRQLLVPRGFLHGFLTLLPNTEVQYKCTDYYAPECDGGVRWDSVPIAWPLAPGSAPVLSQKDALAVEFSGFLSPFTYEASS